MPTNEFMVITILSCGLVTWLSRILPFVLLKRLEIGQKVQEFLSFVPIAIMSGLWFNALFIQHLGHLPGINWSNLLASLPTVLAAILSKNLILTVIIGVISLAVVQVII